MIRLTPEITFDDRDEYLRRPVAENVIRLLDSDARVSPLVIDGGWRAGKTEFCFKLINLLKGLKPEYRPIYIDAFSADHADEPLVTLLASVLAAFPEASDRRSIIEKAVPVVRYSAKAALKASVAWILREKADDLAGGLRKELEKGGNELVDHAIESLLDDHLNARQNIDILKGVLDRLARKEPIVIFVDELDRCRPDYAVSVLESIKHVFNVNSVQFVLVANLEQLRACINHE